MNRKYTGVLPLDHRGVESIANFPVDVLAVMDAAQCALEMDARREQAEEINEARAAVAELIEAVEAERKGDYFDSEDEFWSDFSNRRRKQKERVAAALSRVKGA